MLGEPTKTRQSPKWILFVVQTPSNLWRRSKGSNRQSCGGRPRSGTSRPSRRPRSEAAHIHSPDHAPEALLDTYEQERKPHLRQLVETTKALGLIIGELDPSHAAERDEQLELEMKTNSSFTIRQSLIPNLTAGLIALDSAGMPSGPAGQLSPQPLVLEAGGRTVLLDELSGSRFLLLTLGAEPQQWVSAEASAAWNKLNGIRLIAASPGTPLVNGTVVETQRVLRDWMVAQNCQALLVRPDKYIYGGVDNEHDLNHQMLDLCSDDDLPLIRQRLRRPIGRPKADP